MDPCGDMDRECRALPPAGRSLAAVRLVLTGSNWEPVSTEKDAFVSHRPPWTEQQQPNHHTALAVINSQIQKDCGEVLPARGLQSAPDWRQKAGASFSGAWPRSQRARAIQTESKKLTDKQKSDRAMVEVVGAIFASFINGHFWRDG